MNKKLYMSIIFIATLFISIGYASVNSVSLDIKGLSKAKSQNDIYITEVISLSGDSSLSNVSNDGTLLTSKITLDNDKDSITSIKVQLYNSTNIKYIFKNIVYTNEAYDNEDITFTFNKQNENIEPGKTLEVTLTFKYDNYNTDSLNVLNSLLNFKFAIASQTVAEYAYTGNYETFIVPKDGIYKIELWGSGGEIYENVHSETVGKGGYTSGNIYLTEGEKLYIYVGNEEDFNGGGSGEAGGGGATDVRLVSGSWDSFDSLKSRIMVAAGGGGGIIRKFNGFLYTYEGNEPGHGGGLVGYDANYNITNASVPGYGYSGHGATQTDGGEPGKPSGYYELNPETKGGFGFGGYANAYVEGIAFYDHSSGGGSGYYGGGHGVHTNNAWTGGGGGSSFISGHNGCNAIKEESTKDNIIHAGESTHYSGYKFTNTIMIDGAGYKWTSEKGDNIGMPTHDGSSTMSGNIGKGYAKITFIEEVITEPIKYNITYVGFDDNDYPKTIIENDTLEVIFDNEISNLKVRRTEKETYLSTSDYTFDGKKLIIKNINEDLTIINVDRIRIIPDYTFSNTEYTITMGGHNVYRSNPNTASSYVQTELNGTYDISEMLYVEFDLYVPSGYDLTNLYDVDSQIELSSANFYDINEISYGLQSKEFLDKIKLGEWNHIVIKLSDFRADIQPSLDKTNLNYIGIYWNNTINNTPLYEIPNCKIKNFMFSSYIL